MDHIKFLEMPLAINFKIALPLIFAPVIDLKIAKTNNNFLAWFSQYTYY